MARRTQVDLQQTDTPPESPTFIQTANSRRIAIDANGVHNFDLRRHPGTETPRKLQKPGRQHNQSSISSMSEIKRSPSNDSDSGSIRKRISSLIVGKTDLHKTNSGRSTKSASFEVIEDVLPDTRQELEARLNYHLSELDLLKKTIAAANDTISEHAERYQILQTRSSTDMKCAMQVQQELILQSRHNRNSWVTFVSFHRRQLERIKFRRIQIERDAGLEPTLPQVYNQLWGDEEWGRLFMP